MTARELDRGPLVRIPVFMSREIPPESGGAGPCRRSGSPKSYFFNPNMFRATTQ
jgi:hypothetical protein